VLHYRKNIGGQWETCSLTVEEAKSIQEKIIRIGLGKLKEIQAVAEANKISITDPLTAVILAKVMPSYESLANDYIEAQIKKKNSLGGTPA
jgi:hypothetical protein